MVLKKIPSWLLRTILVMLMILLLFSIPVLTIYLAADESSLKNIYFPVRGLNRTAVGEGEILTEVIHKVSIAIVMGRSPFGGLPLISFLSSLFNVTLPLEFSIPYRHYLNALYPLIFVAIVSALSPNVLGGRVGSRLYSLIYFAFLLLTVSSISIPTLYSYFHYRGLITEQPAALHTSFIASIPFAAFIALLSLYREVYKRHFVTVPYLIFFTWYALFWTGCLGLWEGTSYSTVIRYSSGYIILTVELLILILIPHFLLFTPYAFHLNTIFKEFFYKGKKRMEPPKGLLRGSRRACFKQRIGSIFEKHVISSFLLYYEQVMFLGGELMDLIFISFTTGLFITFLYATLLPFYLNAISPEFFKYEPYDISKLLQDLSILIGAILMWTGPMIAMLLFPERLISTSMAARIRSIIEKRVIAVIGGSNRMVRSFLDKLLPVLLEKSDSMLREDGSIVKISKKICVIDYTGSLSDITYEDPLVGSIGLIEHELIDGERLLIPCLSKYSEDRADSTRDLLNTLCTITHGEPIGIFVLSRDPSVQRACMERYSLRRRSGSLDTKQVIMIATETVTHYRKFHKIAYGLATRDGIQKGNSMSYSREGDTLFFELYHNTLAEAMLHRIFSLFDEGTRRIVIIGASKVLGYLARLIVLSRRCVFGGSQQSNGLKLSIILYPPPKTSESFTVMRDEGVQVKEAPFLRWADDGKIEEILRGIEVEVDSLHHYPLYTLLKSELGNKLRDLMTDEGSNIIVLLEDPKKEGWPLEITDILLSVLNVNGKRLLIGEGSLLDLVREHLELFKKAHPNIEVEVNYLYDETVDPFAVVCREMLREDKPFNLYNAYFCIDEGKLLELIGSIEGTNCSASEHRIILPKVYSCSYNPEKKIYEAFIGTEVNNSISYSYIYLCVPNNLKISEVLSGLPTKNLTNDSTIKRRVDCIEFREDRTSCDDKTSQSRDSNWLKYSIFPPIKEEKSSSNQGEEKMDERDENCPGDLACPLTFVNFSKSNTVPEKIRGSKILLIKTRPCFSSGNIRKIFVEFYLKKTPEDGEGGRHGVSTAQSKGSTPEGVSTPQLDMIKDICPIILHKNERIECYNNKGPGKEDEMSSPCYSRNFIVCYVRSIGG